MASTQGRGDTIGINRRYGTPHSRQVERAVQRIVAAKFRPKGVEPLPPSEPRGRLMGGRVRTTVAAHQVGEPTTPEP